MNLHLVFLQLRYPAKRSAFQDSFSKPPFRLNLKNLRFFDQLKNNL